MADIHVWPFFERAPSVGALFDLDLLPAASFPRLTAWIAAMEGVEAVKKCRSSNDLHKRFFETFVPSGEPQYDLDLEPDSTKPWTTFEDDIFEHSNGISWLRTFAYIEGGFHTTASSAVYKRFVYELSRCILCT